MSKIKEAGKKASTIATKNDFVAKLTEKKFDFSLSRANMERAVALRFEAVKLLSRLLLLEKIVDVDSSRGRVFRLSKQNFTLIPRFAEEKIVKFAVIKSRDRSGCVGELDLFIFGVNALFVLHSHLHRLSAQTKRALPLTSNKQAACLSYARVVVIFSIYVT